MIERDGNNVKVNLTGPFLVWTVLWAFLALLTGVNALWWVAAAPWIFLGGFFLLMFIVAGIAMGGAYRRGVPIKVTNRKGESRVIRRNR